MKLYYYPGACSLAPHIVAREAGIALDLDKVDLANRKTATGDDYLAINSKGYVPALVLDGGEVLTEVAVICQYLADQRPESGLVPQWGTMARYHQMEALNFAATEVHKQIGALFNPQLTAEMKAVQLETIARRLGTLDGLLDGKPYVTGERFTAADAYLFTVLNWTGLHGIDVSRWPAVKAYMARIAERPKVQEAMRAEGLIS